ncbi:MAG: hypothetical protein K1X75_13585 [Leptospirales bacterium]|nr:hypothetical protein [Leptospirales bacterium]
MGSALLRAVAPGRICLFGEHQDYLGLPVLAMAIDRIFQIEYWPNNDPHFTVETPDLPGAPVQQFDIHASAPRDETDFCWGIARVLLEEGFRLPRGGRLLFRSTIPIRAGCSSSSAMCSAWLRLLLEIGEHPRRAEYIADRELCAYLAYLGEKEKFNGAGGMMDQYSCYLGGLIYVFPEDYPDAPGIDRSGALRKDRPIPYGALSLPLQIEGFVLIDSGVPKDTQGILGSASDRARRSLAAAQRAMPSFDLRQTSVAEFEAAAPAMSEEARKVVLDHLRNRDLCQRGLQMLSARPDANELGAMLNEEHRILSQTLQTSTARIDQLQALSNAHGALGGKINGSGGGGALFCYAPGNQKELGQALDDAGVRWFAVRSDPGARLLD